MLRLPTISWATIRSIGELRFLNRVSYAGLVVVPILAWLWPYLITASCSIEHDKELACFMDSGVGGYYDESWDRTIAKSELIPNNKTPPKGRFCRYNIDFPRTLILTFFGSLFVVLGHSLYQINVPNLISKFKEIDFSLGEVEGGGYVNTTTSRETYRAIAASGSIIAKYTVLALYSVGFLLFVVVLIIQTVAVYQVI